MTEVWAVVVFAVVCVCALYVFIMRPIFVATDEPPLHESGAVNLVGSGDLATDKCRAWFDDQQFSYDGVLHMKVAGGERTLPLTVVTAKGDFILVSDDCDTVLTRFAAFVWRDGAYARQGMTIEHGAVLSRDGRRFTSGGVTYAR